MSWDFLWLSQGFPWVTLRMPEDFLSILLGVVFVGWQGQGFHSLSQRRLKSLKGETPTTNWTLIGPQLKNQTD